MTLFGKLFLASLAVAWMSSVGAEKIDEFKKKYLDLMENQKCMPGFKGMASIQKEAAEKCGSMKDIVSYYCYITCVYRTFEYLIDGKDDELDYAIADYASMESYNMNHKAGRDSYWKVALGRFRCAEEYVDTKKVKFALKYDNADACQKAEPFFKCTFLALTCNSKDAE